VKSENQRSPTNAFPEGYEFTNNWFDANTRAIWNELLPTFSPTRILEIGAFEGAGACYLINSLGNQHDLEIHCVDTWLGGLEHEALGIDMACVEQRYQRNVQLAIASSQRRIDLRTHKTESHLALATLTHEKQSNVFDFIFIDGSHQAPDVMRDAAMSFTLLKVGGIMGFDDYLWYEDLPYGLDLVRCPKPAIDSFINLYWRKLSILRTPMNQVYIRKLTE